jgi:lipopolysaccharide transport system ATP-binding protein
MTTAVHIQGVSKLYRLGEVGTGTLSHDINRWWHKVRGKEDPYLKLGTENKREQSGGEYVWAVKDVSFDVEQGEVLGIIGRNGAGKSTLLKLLSRVTQPTTGIIKAKGRIASLLEVGTGFHPELTGGENIYLNGAIMGMTKAEIKQKFDEIVNFAGVEKYIDTPVKRYSSGMYVRLAFAVAAHLEPEILIVDEVLAVGDAEFQRKCLGKMEEVSKGHGRTLLFVSHNMASIQKLCNKTVVMEHGKVGFHGNTGEAINFYLNNNKITDADWSSRKGTGKVRLKEFELVDSNGKPRTEFIMGDDVYLKLRIRCLEDVNNLDIGVNLKNLFDESISHITNLDSNYRIDVKENTEIEVTVRVEKLFFSPGFYNIDIGIISQYEILDMIENIISFQVLQSSAIHRPGGFPSHVRTFSNSVWQLQ